MRGISALRNAAAFRLASLPAHTVLTQVRDNIAKTLTEVKVFFTVF